MRRAYLAGFLLLLACTALLFYFWYSGSDKKQNAGAVYPYNKHLRMRFKLSNTTEEVLKNVVLKVHSPVIQSANQKLIDLKSRHRYRSSLDALGNQELEFVVEQLNPYESRFIELRVNLNMAVTPQAFSYGPPGDFMNSGEGIETEHPLLKKLSERFGGNGDRQRLFEIYDWIRNHLEYAGYIEEDLGSTYALENRTGDCTEYAYLMAALARHSGIPARVISGFVYQDDAVVKAKDLHNWTEVYLDGAWHIIDPQKQRFLERYSDYVAYKIIDDGESEAHSRIVDIQHPKVELSL